MDGDLSLPSHTPLARLRDIPAIVVALRAHRPHTHTPQIFSSLRRLILRFVQAICLLHDGHPALVCIARCTQTMA